MQITSGKIPGPIKLCLYGIEGIGKSTLASKFPMPLFIDTEGSTNHMDVRRLPAPGNWLELLNEVDWVMNHPDSCKTLVIDTVDWAEMLCIENVCAKEKKDSLEAFGYGKGYVYVAEEFGRLLNKLENVREKGIHILLLAHAKIQKFEQPDELGAYDRWTMKTSKQVAPMIKEWVDCLLFANYKTLVVNVDGQGAAKGKNKAQGGQRVLYTTHMTSWDAKNRFGLADELPLDYASIAPILDSAPASPTPEPDPAPAPEPQPAPQPEPEPEMAPTVSTPDPYADIPDVLARLMREADVSPDDVKHVIAEKGFFPFSTPWRVIVSADGFLDGWLMHPNVWPQVVAAAKEVPF